MADFIVAARINDVGTTRTELSKHVAHGHGVFFRKNFLIKTNRCDDRLLKHVLEKLSIRVTRGWFVTTR